MRFGRVSLLLLGSFLVYCAQDMVGQMHPGGSRDGGAGGALNDGMVGRADAQSSGGACCTPAAPTGVVLFDKTFNGTPLAGAPTSATPCISPPIDVSGYRSIVIHSTPSSTVTLLWSFGGAAGWKAESAVLSGIDTRDTHLGKTIALQTGVSSNGGGSCSIVAPASATVVGYAD